MKILATEQDRSDSNTETTHYQGSGVTGQRKMIIHMYLHTVDEFYGLFMLMQNIYISSEHTKCV